ncbi:MAG: hypothetical protein ABF746_08755 [Acetobacter orientalis]|uniref:hypothetical protein n=1 Tax=Acetobacter orientalis TaxID=146474 RepID=UPI0039ED1988
MAAPQLADLVLETSNAPGTGLIVLGGAPDGRQTFADAFPAGGEVYYYASDGQQTEWGVGTLTVGSPNTLARTTVLGNLFGTKTVLNFTQNITVWCEIPAEKCLRKNDDGALPVRAETDYTQDEAVSAKSADARYAKITDPLVRSLIMPDSDYLIDKIAAHKSNGRLWFHYTDKDGKEQYPEAALASDLDAKPNLVGANKFSGGKQVISADNQANPLLIATQNGQGFEFGFDQDVTFLDLHSVTAGNGADFDSRIIASGDITKGSSRLNFETNSLTWSNSPIALQSQLPFSDTGLKIQAFQVKGNNVTRVSFPTAFRVGTVPYVFLQINNEPGGVSRASPIVNVGSANNPDINNANFRFQPLFFNGSNNGSSGQDFTLDVLAVGYF